MTDSEIGLVFARLLQYNRLDGAGDRHAVLTQIVEAQGFVLPGGLRAVGGDRAISPSCCCGLEGWRQWQDFLKTGETPWLGHDPSPWVERRGDVVRIWLEGGLGDSAKNAFFLEVPSPDFREALMRVERDLQGFLFCVESWGQALGFERSHCLMQKLGQCFEIGSRHTNLS
jgi:hypothetical protein